MARDLFADPGRSARELAELSTRRLNLDPEAAQPASRAEGWRIDDYRQALPREPAGPPVAGGSWEVACALLLDYDFVDPSIVRAAFRPVDPLDGRDMLLELRLWGLRFHVGVRVVAVRDGRVANEGRGAAVWGWSYATLDGHFEVGRMDYEVRKWLDTGEVEFRIHAFSRVAHIPNLLVRLGFRVFGRRKQTQFARRACERMRRRTERAIARPPEGGVVLRPTW
ncbi:MAG TPA: DUF1990 family protein [Thermoleophilaceae bacterium]|nr:DUF1990 family protein [Thermoleophilaceae bacterium]